MVNMEDKRRDALLKGSSGEPGQRLVWKPRLSSNSFLNLNASGLIGEASNTKPLACAQGLCSESKPRGWDWTQKSEFLKNIWGDSDAPCSKVIFEKYY